MDSGSSDGEDAGESPKSASIPEPVGGAVAVAMLGIGFFVLLTRHIHLVCIRYRKFYYRPKRSRYRHAALLPMLPYHHAIVIVVVNPSPSLYAREV